MSEQIQKIIVRLLVTVNNELLIVKRSDDTERPGEWEFPGGSVGFGETFEQAAIRGLEEETKINTSNIELYDTFSYVERGEHTVGVIYKIPLAVVPEVSLSEEHAQYAWVGKSTWRQYDFSSVYNSFLTEYYRGKVEENDATNTTENAITLKEAIIFADGGSRGNPGPSATGYAIFDSNESEVARGGEYIGITTNNQAEYLAVKQGLQRARELGVQKVQFYLDSMLVVNQMKGIYKVRNKDLWPVHESIKQLSEGIEISFEHVRREKNKVADSIVNEVLDQHEDEQ